MQFMATRLTPLFIALLGIAATIATSAPQPETSRNGAAVKLEAIGGLAASNAQHTFLLLRATSDAFKKDVYDARQVRTAARGVVRQLDTVCGLLRRVQDSGLSDEDDDYVDRLVESYRLLSDEARALNRYAEKRGESEANALERAREASHRSLKSLLGRSPWAIEESTQPVDDFGMRGRIDRSGED